MMMSIYYFIITIMAVFAMFGMLVCVNTSGTLDRSKKKYFRLLFLTVAIATFCEWFGIYLQGTGEATRVLHICVKALELSLAPSIALWIANVIEVKFTKITYAFLIVNVILEILSGYFGFIYSVDANSTYTHANFYWIYTLVYFISILYGIFIIVRNVKKYQYNGIGFFIMTVLLLSFAIVIQMVNSEIKVIYIGIALASIMLYVFTLEMIQQSDELTGLINRRGYENYIAHIDESCIFLVLDIDNFKYINDNYGHLFGDECIRKVGTSLRTTYSKYGKCFRIGGDEFCFISKNKQISIEEINSEYFKVLSKYREKEKRFPYVSLGYVEFNPQMNSIQGAFEEADKMMYKYKEEHKRGRDVL